MGRSLVKVSEYPFKQNKNMLVLLYTYFHNISLNVLRITFFNIYIIYDFYALQISVKLGSKLGQKLTTFPIFWVPAPTELQFSIIFFHWYVANQETKPCPRFSSFQIFFLNNLPLAVFMQNTLSKLVELLQ